MLGLWESIFLEDAGASGVLDLIWNSKKVDIYCLEFSNNWMCSSVQSLKSDLKFILIKFLFQICYGLCGNSYILYCKFPYRKRNKEMLLSEKGYMCS